MKKKMILFTVMSIIFIVPSCNEAEVKSNIYSCQCDSNRESMVIKSLTNASAIVKFSELIDDFTIELTIEELEDNYLLIPCDNSLPNKYKSDGLAVQINADVISCIGNTPPNIKMFPFYLLKITKIQKK